MIISQIFLFININKYMSDDNINDYLPSILNPRTVKRNNSETKISSTQNSVTTRRSLSLKKNKNDGNTLNKKEVTHNDTSLNARSKNKAFSVFPTFSVEFGVKNCDDLNISTKNTDLKRVLFSNKNNHIIVDCEVVKSSQISVESDVDEGMSESLSPSPAKRANITVNLEIKRKDLSVTEDVTENPNILVLNTNAIDKLSHVIVQPPNYKLVKKKIPINGKFVSSFKKKAALGVNIKHGDIVHGDYLRQKSIVDYCPNKTKIKISNEKNLVEVLGKKKINNENILLPIDYNNAVVMNKISGVSDGIKCDNNGRTTYNINPRDNDLSPHSAKVTRKENNISRHQNVKGSSSDVPQLSSCRRKNESLSSHSPKRNLDLLHFQLPTKSKSYKTSASTRNIPHYKIVPGTHFAVDAFSYGDIPNVKHYFLTHFHADHYSGLKKSFNKMLFCSKITADLCVSRLGVSHKYINIMNTDETIHVEDVDVTAVDANHCPGAIMLVFTLPSGKTILHTGDFRASLAMESYPIFWNKDIHTIYLDTTYCNPRYDFPTQDQSLEMALYHLRQKKTTLEKAGKKFSTVLIVCGTYTIGKEKFFLGLAHLVGCSVWACPEKDRVLQVVEGRSFSHLPPQSCQLHVVPIRDLTHEKLRRYLDSLQGSFSEVVAFKPSGWENGKNSTVKKDLITIHGIPYSEHSSFSELIRFVKFLKPKYVVPTVDISGGIKAVQKYFPCPLVYKEDIQYQSKVTDFFSIVNRQQVPAVT